MDRKRQKLTPGKTKKKLKLSTPETTSQPSNPHAICDKEVVIQLERLSDSVVAEATAGGSALPPEQAKIKLKLSTTKTKLHPSNHHFICDKEVVIQLERLSDSFVAEMTADGSVLPPEQVSIGSAEVMADSCYIAELKETIEKMNAELIQSHTKISELNAKVREQEEAARKEMAKLQEQNDGLARDLKESEEKCRAVQERLELAEQRLTQFSLKADATAEESLAQVNESNDDALGINSLPDEIIVEVFGYLTQNQLGQIARVCRSWNVLTKSPVLWRKVNVKIFSSVTEKNIVAKYFINGLPSCVTFIRLDCLGCEKMDFEELCVKLHQNCPHLEELILTHCGITNILPEVINFCTQFLQCVKKLVFCYCHFSKSFRTVELNDNSKIEVLDLYGCNISNSSKTQFSKLLQLKELRLTIARVDDTWFEDDTSFLNELHVLDLRWTCITARTFRAIQRHGHNLKELYLCCCVNLKGHLLNFTDSKFPQLKTICLFNHFNCFSVTCEDVVSLIQSCPSLETVYVNETVAGAFAAHPFVLANRCESGIAKTIGFCHIHKVDYPHN